MSQTQAFPLYAVEITRGKDVITVDVPEHEVRVLKVIHDLPNAAMVAVKGPSGGLGEDQETRELPVDINEEFDRLIRTYQRVNAPNPVLIAYPGGASELARFGFGVSDGPVAQKPGSLVKKGKPDKAKKPEPAKEVPKTDPPKDDAGKK